MDFKTSAKKTKDQHKKDFSGFFGELLVSQGILSREQIDQTGEVQAQMIAIRDAIENPDHHLTLETVN